MKLKGSGDVFGLYKIILIISIFIASAEEHFSEFKLLKSYS